MQRVVRGGIADMNFANVEKVNAELFTLTYGAIVRQLLTDFDDVEEVNKQLDTMGYNMGIRLIDEFLAKANVQRCSDFRESIEITARVSLRIEAQFVRDMLKGDEAFEIRVKLLEQVAEEYPYKDDQ
eukprot:TRINITY_DN6501_c0_g1_i3.p1 TRINITY_DN6501_c0_g1~~TRINITY_DN6501_c0_g1_i3.p1  ORF type:complete len:127 (+),score=48.77 TRINITY_DN6501_c0_g1_i3:210-590(+)